MGATKTNGRVRIKDVFLSDFVGDTGTPLQWFLAWEVVAKRERQEREQVAKLEAIKAPLTHPVLRPEIAEQLRRHLNGGPAMAVAV